jgi:hypothetical protein
MRRLSILLLLLAAPALAKREATPPACPAPVKPALFISPAGEPFRPRGDDDDPVRRWFDQADRDHDGKLTIGEMMLDADRFFATLDRDGNGELLPDEVQAYEQDVAPEIRLYQRRPEPDADDARKEEKPERPRSDRRRAGQPGAYAQGVLGAGRYAFLNIPNPVAAADTDFNRAISMREFGAAAAGRFRDLDPQQTKALSFAALPRTPAQQAATAACLERLKEKRR